jgi:hypothetical protein
MPLDSSENIFPAPDEMKWVQRDEMIQSIKVTDEILSKMRMTCCTDGNEENEACENRKTVVGRRRGRAAN